MSIERENIIAGPCAAQSREQVISTAKYLLERGIPKMRASWFKPRTMPGYEGEGINAAPWAAEATNMGIEVGTEVLTPHNVSDVVNGIARCGGDITKQFMWIGSRNQNHMIQRDIGRAVLNETPENVMLLIKNQPWYDPEHSVGIVEHVLNSGIDPKRLAYIWRGIKPHPSDQNEHHFKNLPFFDIAMQVKERIGEIPMLLDPSHIGGTVENAMRVMQMANGHDFEGAMVEINPLSQEERKTDKGQQLSFNQFDNLLNQLES